MDQMDDLKSEYIKIIENESWSSLAQMAVSFKITIKENGYEGRRLKKEIEMLKRVIHEQLKGYDNGVSVPSSFFIGMVKTIRNVESSFERAAVADKAFIYFLKALLHKAKKERIIATKPFERKFEFERLKSMSGSDNYDAVRNPNKA